jgi:hypothetical protein
VLLVLLVLGTGSCSRQSQNTRETEGGKVRSKTIEEVLDAHTDELMAVPGVVGTAVGECAGRPCIKVLVTKKTGALEKRIPSALEGFPVELEETGEIRALDSS